MDFDILYSERDQITDADLERWDDERRLAHDRKRREAATEEERQDPNFDVPY